MAYESVSEQCFTSPPTQYIGHRLYGRRFLQEMAYGLSNGHVTDGVT